jgi:hypothetical protein
MNTLKIISIAIVIVCTGPCIVLWLIWLDSICRTRAVKKYKDNVR